MSQAAIKSAIAAEFAALASSTTLLDPDPAVHADLIYGKLATALYNALQKGGTDPSTIAAGEIGYLLSIARDRNNALGLTSGTAANIGNGGTSVTLTTGRWRLSGAVGFLPDTSTEIRTLVAAVSATSGTLPVAVDVQAHPVNGEVWQQFSTPAAIPTNNMITVPIPSYIVDVAPSATRQLFLVARGSFPVAPLSAYGYLHAELIR